MRRATPFFLALLVLGGCVSPPPPIQKAPAAEAAQLNLRLGVGYLQQGHFDVALEKLKKAIDLDPNLPEAHNAIAVLYEETGDPRLAEQHYRRAVELQPGYALARMNYGRILCENGKPAEGEVQFLKAAADPKPDAQAEAYTGAAICALAIPAIPDRQKAREYLNKAMALRPDTARTLYQMADLGYAEGKYQEARGFLQRYHAQAGYNPQSLWLAISIEEALGDQQRRQEYAQLLMARFADSSQARQLKFKR